MKIVLLGDEKSGKTQFLNRYVNNIFSSEYKTTIGADFGTRKFFFTNVSSPVSLQMWDTAGQERFASLATAFMPGADAFIITLDITSRESLNNLHKHIGKIKYDLDRRAPIFVVMTKIDLKKQAVISDDEYREAVVSLQQKNTELNIVSNLYFTSARSGEGIESCVGEIATQVARTAVTSKSLSDDDLKEQVAIKQLRDELETAKLNLRNYLTNTLTPKNMADKPDFCYANPRYDAANKIILAIPPSAPLTNPVEIIKLRDLVYKTLGILQDPRQQLDDYVALIQTIGSQPSWGKIVAGAMLTFLSATLLGIFVTASIASFGGAPALAGLTLYIGISTLAQGLTITGAILSGMATVAGIATVGGIILRSQDPQNGVALAAHGFLRQTQIFVEKNKVYEELLDKSEANQRN